MILSHELGQVKTFHALMPQFQVEWVIFYDSSRWSQLILWFYEVVRVEALIVDIDSLNELV